MSASDTPASARASPARGPPWPSHGSPPPRRPPPGGPLRRRGDKLALLIDGGALCENETRAAVLTRARQVIERLLADPAPHPGTELALVVTKWDLIAGDAGAMAYWQPREEQLLAEFRRLDPTAPHLRVAAGAAAGYPGDDGFA